MLTSASLLFPDFGQLPTPPASDAGDPGNLDLDLSIAVENATASSSGPAPAASPAFTLAATPNEDVNMTSLAPLI